MSWPAKAAHLGGMASYRAHPELIERNRRPRARRGRNLKRRMQPPQVPIELEAYRKRKEET